MRAAWRQAFGRDPLRREVYAAMAVAEHETHQGDDWPGTHNYGAVQWRVPTDAEKQQIKAGTLKKGSLIPGGILEGDSSPDSGGYWCWFRTFPGDVEGAVFFLHMLRSADNAAALRVGDELGTATGMYLHGYFEGVNSPGRPRFLPHDPNTAHRRPATLAELAVNAFTKGELKNVTDYAGACQKIYDRFYAALEALHWGSDLAEMPPGEPAPELEQPTDLAPAVWVNKAPIPAVAAVGLLAVLAAAVSQFLHACH